ncbi:MAG: Cellulosome-anchoring protein precursor [Pelotomaculum sp. PtaB.Bin013]|nr:MAG: Cellulosome-anchoring protein precursor [Pelotomaculum sp. PtaB.Bin013]
MRYLAEKGIISGFPDGTFRPTESLTRAQAAKVMVLTKNLSEVKEISPTYQDVPADHWAFGVIEAATKAGLFTGYPDGTFNPDGVITRAEAIALLFRLSGGALSDKKVEIGDVATGHWAYRQVATAIEAGLVELPSDKLFQPDLAFRRGDLARSLSAMITIGPDLRTAALTGKLTVKKGKVTFTTGDGVSHEVGGEEQISAGTKVATDNQGKAEITFDDGSGMLLEANTIIEITKAEGFTYMRQDGSPGVAVDKLVVKLKQGNIFGALASRYDNPAQTTGEKKTAFFDKVEKHTLVLASTEMPPGLSGILIAEGGSASGGSEEIPWWNEPYAERERVVVDMPWGVAAIRGTFWMNQVSAGGQSTSLITGHAVVTSGGQTVSVTAGQSTVITSQNAPPTPPAALTQNQVQAWAAVEKFVNERAQEIQNNIPPPPAPVVLPPEMPVEQSLVTVGQQQQTANIVETVKQSYNQVTGSVNTPTATTPPISSGGSNPVLLTRAKAAQLLVEKIGLTPDSSTETLFTDVPLNHSAAGYIYVSMKNGWLIGYPDGSFHPEGRVTRAELATLLCKIFAFPSYVPATPTFSDISMHWAKTFIEKLANKGIINGYPDGTFRPDDYITENDAGTVLSRINVAAYTWSVETVDSAGDVGNYNSMSLDAANNPHISYYDYYDATNGDLKYARWDGTTWLNEMVDGSVCNVGEYTSLALDTSYYPCISYYDATNGDLKYAHWNGTAWQKETVDGSVYDVGKYTSLALDSAGYPRIGYYDATHGDLKYAYWNGTAWQNETVDGSVYNVGEYVSLALDTAGYPHICYRDVDNGCLKYAYKDGSGWHTEIVDGSVDDCVGWYSTIAIDAASHPHIGYYDMTNGDLKYAYKDGSGWHVEIVDSAGTVGWSTSLVLDSDGCPHLSYDSCDSLEIKYAYKNSSGWHIETVTSINSSSESTSIALDSYGHPRISFYDTFLDDLIYITRQW